MQVAGPSSGGTRTYLALLLPALSGIGSSFASNLRCLPTNIAIPDRARVDTVDVGTEGQKA